jgi:glycosyltransferase involved in cell wall biosynthesis
MNKINILAISAGNTGGVAYHRIMIPMNYLMQNSEDEFNVVYAPDEAVIIDAENLKNIHIVHFHANITYNSPLMDKLFDMQKNGCKLVMDMDDYPYIPKHNPAHTAYMQKLHKPILATMSKVDYITTTTKLFAAEIKSMCKGCKVEVFPNVIDKQFEQFIPRPTKSNRLRIGLIGGGSHFKDIELLIGMTKQLKPYKDKIQIVLCGFSAGDTPELTLWNDAERILTDNYSILSDEYKDYLFRYSKTEYPLVAYEPYRRIWSKDINSYGKLYNEVDVLLAPLVNDKFNCMKSELKVVEAGNFGKVFIGSPVGRYKEVVTTGENGILVRNNNWSQPIIALLEDSWLINKLRINLHNYVSERYDIDKWNDKRVKFYKEIV